MPACFQLTRLTDPDAGPVLLKTIDDEICAHLGVPGDPDGKYCYDWYDYIGFKLALGRDWATIRSRIDEDIATYSTEYHEHLQALRKITDFLEAHFTTNAFWAPKDYVEAE